MFKDAKYGAEIELSAGLSPEVTPAKPKEFIYHAVGSARRDTGRHRGGDEIEGRRGEWVDGRIR